MKKNFLFIFYFIFVIFLTLIFLPTDAFAAYPKLVTKIVKGFENLVLEMKRELDLEKK